MLVMGIVNITPDSFADGGRFLGTDLAVDHALRLADEGAEIIDIGGESTRPGSVPVTVEEELRRVIPVIEGLGKRSVCVLSVDTQKPEVAKAALAAGASIINDIAANRKSPDMWEVVAGAKAGYVCMHMQGTPQTMQAKPRYDDVLREVGDFFSERLTKMAEHGVCGEQVALDPGIGFGKNLEHNIKLLSELNRFSVAERPLLVGVSRKSFIGKLLGTTTGDRLPASLACAAWAAIEGAHIVRVHDVAETAQAVRMAEELNRNW
ncbi:MAG: dihydropteroate synthase [Verrucomicrobiota bacterium]|nr:dihydropteroate synthase [Verrucomicrobiota bacterium]MDP7051754.1 dihydropteroate synthase [Verrucomicrobiota bacterium]